ncbi:MAG TPA: VOC family protein [Burkholderiales bacterium]|nr:VOC family protein [Burkholderiales bacterium]
MAVLRMTHIGICVTDVARSIAFYRDLLGFAYRSELRVQGEPSDTLLRLRGVDLHAVYLERDGTRIELLYYAAPGAIGDGAPRAMNGRGLTHLSLRVDNLKEMLPALRAGGARVLDETMIEIPEFGAAAIFIADPDGALIELVQSPSDLEAPPGG